MDAKAKTVQVWPVALSTNGAVCTTATQSGKLQVWDLKISPPVCTRHYETKGSFTMCVDVVSFRIFFMLNR